MASLELREDRCKGCGLCVLACPKKLVRISGRFNRAGYTVAEIPDASSCTGCAFCAEMCPDLVITICR